MAAAEADFDMRAYAEAEIESLVAKQQEVGEALRDMLYDKAAGSDRAGLIVEVRAGIGGDEAALFARDLFEMYRRYAETKNWRFEALEIVPTELGGFREATFGDHRRGGLPPPPVRERRPPGPARPRDRDPGPHPHLGRHRRRPPRARGRRHRHPRRGPRTSSS